MGRIDDEDIRRVREATDLVQLVADTVVLTQKGRLFWGCCPFHNEKTASFKIDPGTQLWHCFGCGKGGDVFRFVMEQEKMEFPEAVRMLADRAHIDIKETGGSGISRNERTRLMDACGAAEEFFHTQLMRSKSQDAAAARTYLGKRDLGTGPSNTWKLGFAPGHGQLSRYLQQQGFSREELIKANLAYTNNSGRMVDRFFNRVMFPVHDLQGRTVAFGGRVIGQGEPKYLNTSETPVFHKSSNMFGIDRAKASIVSEHTAIVVEGYTDVIAMHQAGLTNAIATLGTALTAQHVKLLSRFASSIVYLFDGDAAGQKAAMRASEFIDWESAVESRHNPVDLRVTVLPDNMDPAEFLAAKGAQAMRDHIKKAEPLLDFCIMRTIESYDLNVPEQKVRAIEAALGILWPVRESVLAKTYINKIADSLRLDYTVVSNVLMEMKPPAAARRDQNKPAPPRQEAAQRGNAIAKAMEVSSERSKQELRLVGNIVAETSIIGLLGKDLSTIEWEDQRAKAMVNALLAAGEQITPMQAFSVVSKACPEAPMLLSESSGEFEPGEQCRCAARLAVRDLHMRDIDKENTQIMLRMRRDESKMSQEEAKALSVRSKELQDEFLKWKNMPL